jgi:hypothetical protein
MEQPTLRRFRRNSHDFLSWRHASGSTSVTPEVAVAMFGCDFYIVGRLMALYISCITDITQSIFSGDFSDAPTRLSRPDHVDRTCRPEFRAPSTGRWRSNGFGRGIGRREFRKTELYDSAAAADKLVLGGRKYQRVAVFYRGKPLDPMSCRQ